MLTRCKKRAYQALHLTECNEIHFCLINTAKFIYLFLSADCCPKELRNCPSPEIVLPDLAGL